MRIGKGKIPPDGKWAQPAPRPAGRRIAQADLKQMALGKGHMEVSSNKNIKLFGNDTSKRCKVREKERV